MPVDKSGHRVRELFGQISGGIGSLFAGTLTPRRSNAAGTRMLLTPNAPITMPSTGDPTLSLRWTNRGVTRVGMRHIPTIPHIVSQEQS